MMPINNILLIEHDPIYRVGLKNILEGNGFEVSLGHMQRDVCGDHNIIIIDLDSLESENDEVFYFIESNYECSNLFMKDTIKVIGIYSYYNKYYKPYLFDAILRKPFTPEQLLETINKEYENVKRFYDKTDRGFVGDFSLEHMVQHKRKEAFQSL